MSRSSAPRSAAVRSLALALALCATAPAAALAQEVLTEVSPVKMAKILTDLGIEAELGGDDDTPRFRFEYNGYRMLLFLANQNTDAQLYIGFLDGEISDRELNDWNRDHRFSRAYRDKDDDAVLEADLDFTGGVTEANIKAWIRLFASLAQDYAKVVD
ncbi:MAG TPA: YbjN domain-containing protein [Gemmatimonadales bacterium]|nr:YbjN domain-containing protein [Gemmatimonadales bacterium]